MSQPAPIAHLPFEILQYIFFLVSEDDDDTRTTRRALTHVCRFWREGALSTPTLWATLSLLPRRVNGRRQIMMQDFERAKSPDLHIVMHWSREKIWLREDQGLDRNELAADRSLYFELVFARQHRWRSFSIDLIPLQDLDRLNKELRGASFPNLRFFTTTCGTSLQNLGTIPTKLVCAAAVHLTHMDLAMVNLCDPLHPIAFPSSLRSLIITRCSISPLSRFAEVLSSLHCLAYLEIAGHSLPYGESHHLELSGRALPIQLLQLRSLSLAHSVDRHDSWFVRQFDCPNVENLRLRSDGRPCFECPEVAGRRTFVDELLRAIAAKNWRLTCFDGNNSSFYINSPSSNFLLSPLSCIRRLVIHSDDIDTVLGVLPSSHPSIPPLCVCPALEELNVGWVYSTESLVSVLSAVTKRTREPRSCLRALYVRWLDTAPNRRVEELLSQLGKLVKLKKSWDESPFKPRRIRPGWQDEGA